MMNQSKKLLIPLTIICLMFFIHLAPVFADDNNSSGIEKIVETENCRTIYFQNGTKHIELTFSMNLNMGFSMTSSTGISTVTLIPIFLIERILDIIQQIFEGIFCPLGIASSLLATEIMIIFKNLRHNRPKDYNGVICEKIAFSALHFGHVS